MRYNSVMTTLSTTGVLEDDRRRVVLEVAARLLSEEGPAGLTLRRVAAGAGGSTQLVYTLFGGKPGLAAALHGEGFARLAAAMDAGLAAAPPAGDPERLVALGRAYCDFAVAEPAFFGAMFSASVAGHVPDPPTRSRSRASTLGRVVSTAQECLDAGTLAPADAEVVAQCCWAAAHGAAGLRVAGLLEDALVEPALRAAVTAHRPAGAR